MNEILNITELNPATTRKFKDARLADATKRIAAIYTDAAKFVDTKNREIASILSQVMDEKSYEKDGFKSVGDYALEVFGIKRQNAYALASAGKVYNDKSAPAELKAMTPSKLAEVAKVDAAEIKKAIADGTIKSDSTQKELRDFAAQVKQKSEKPKIVEKYTVRACSIGIAERDVDNYNTARTIDEWDEYFMDYMQSLSPVRPPEIIKLSKTAPINVPDAKKASVQRHLYVCDTFSLVVEFYVEKKQAKPAKPKFTREQLMAMLAELD